MRRGGKPPLLHHTALSHLHQYNGDTRVLWDSAAPSQPGSPMGGSSTLPIHSVPSGDNPSVGACTCWEHPHMGSTHGCHTRRGWHPAMGWHPWVPRTRRGAPGTGQHPWVAGAPCVGPRARRRAQMERAGQRGERGRLGAALISRGLFIGSFCRLPSVPGCESGGRQQPNGADAAPLLLSHLGCCESRHPRARSGKGKHPGGGSAAWDPTSKGLGCAGGFAPLNVTHSPCLVGKVWGALWWCPRGACAGGEAPASPCPLPGACPVSPPCSPCSSQGMV